MDHAESKTQHWWDYSSELSSVTDRQRIMIEGLGDRKNEDADLENPPEGELFVMKGGNGIYRQTSNRIGRFSLISSLDEQDREYLLGSNMERVDERARFLSEFIGHSADHDFFGLLADFDYENYEINNI